MANSNGCQVRGDVGENQEFSRNITGHKLPLASLSTG